MTQPEPKPYPHHRLKGTVKRVRLGGGPPVDQSTLADLKSYQKRGLSYGDSIDRSMAYAKKRKYDLVTQRHEKKA